MSLLFNMLSRLVIAFLPRSKHLLISWLQSPSAEILEPKKIKAKKRGRGPKGQIVIIHQIIENAREFQKNIYFFTDYAKVFDCVDHNNCEKFFKRREYQTTLPASWEICIQVKKQQLELDMEQQTCSKLENSKFSRQEYWSGVPLPSPRLGTVTVYSLILFQSLYCTL